MIDIAIIGGGLCGLALARQLHQQGRDVQVFEARERLGGRILSLPVEGTLSAVDLGPTWFWPQQQPRLAALIAELGLSHFAQYDSGQVLELLEPDKGPRVSAQKKVHAGASRLQGGMGSLISALSAALPSNCLHLNSVLTAVRLQADRVELQLQQGEHRQRIYAQRVVLALPPRLVAQQVQFEPALNAALLANLHTTPTWMAAQAKVVIQYETPQWRADGYAGSAFVQHEQATLGEIYDACDAAGLRALGGFVALPPKLRRQFATGLPMLLSNQMQQVFGHSLLETMQYYQDWASEAFTCSSADIAEFNNSSAVTPAMSLVREPQWQQRLFFGGSETAQVEAGYLEGALDAAQRIAATCVTLPVASTSPVQTTVVSFSAVSAGSTATGLHSGSSAINTDSLSSFTRWVKSRQLPTFEDYRKRLNTSLALQQHDQLTQRALLAAMEQVLADALSVLQLLPFDTRGIVVERGRSALTLQVQAAFHGFMTELLEAVVAFNATSCALSNFPHEHKLSKEYEQTILRDIAAAWREFSLNTNAELLSRPALLFPGAARQRAPSAASPEHQGAA
jgi:monoamine oxidase